jgi:hypothetical protein
VSTKSTESTRTAARAASSTGEDVDLLGSVDTSASCAGWHGHAAGTTCGIVRSWLPSRARTSSLAFASNGGMAATGACSPTTGAATPAAPITTTFGQVVSRAALGAASAGVTRTGTQPENRFVSESALLPRLYPMWIYFQEGQGELFRTIAQKRLEKTPNG